MTDDRLIVVAIRRYYEDWEPPEDTGREWIKCLCPFHGESRKSAVVSFEHNAFKCYACPVSGSAVTIIKDQEGVSFAEAYRIAEELSQGSDRAVPQQPARQSRRRVFGEQGSEGSEYRSGREQVPAGIRGRATPWA